MGTKICTKCKKEKQVSDFDIDKRPNRAGYQSQCKTCRSECMKELYKRNKERIINRNKIWREENAEHKRKIGREHYHNNKERYIENGKIYRQGNAEKIKASRKKYKESNKEIIKIKSTIYKNKNSDTIKQKAREYAKKYYPQRKKKLIEYNRIRNKERLQTDPVFKLKTSLRIRIRHVFKRMFIYKKQSTKQLVGCEFETLKEHIEKQFTEGMAWTNHGEWHIDHKIPLAIATTEEEVKALCHYTNLQPLWAIDNLKKGARLITGEA